VAQIEARVWSLVFAAPATLSMQNSYAGKRTPA